MFKNTLHSIKQYILQHNVYFNAGYSNVYMDEKGIREGETPVFPADRLGDYFYMRLPNGATITNSRAASVSDCVAGLQAKMSAILVACVRNADYDILATNIISTLAQYGNISVTNVMWQPEEIILQELKTMSEDVVNAALARLDPNQTIVCVKFDYTDVIQQSGVTCLPNPCACS